MIRPLIVALTLFVALGATNTSTGPALASPSAAASSCTVERVIDGDTFVCDDGVHVRMLQINAPEIDACGGEWARAALANFFLQPGTFVKLDYDDVTTDRYDRTLAAPIVTGTDGADYNISIVMAYVGLAKAAYYGDNAKYLDWAQASENWARNAQWNMWKPGGPFSGGADCGGGGAPPPPPAPREPEPPVYIPPDPATGGNCNPNYSGACLDQPGDYDCAGGSGNGPNYTDTVTVVGSDPYDLDRDNDGVGCE